MDSFSELVADHGRWWLSYAEAQRLLGKGALGLGGRAARQQRGERMSWRDAAWLRAEMLAVRLLGLDADPAALMALKPADLHPANVRMLFGAWLGGGDAAHLHRLCELVRAPGAPADAALEGELLLAAAHPLAAAHFPTGWEPAAK